MAAEDTLVINPAWADEPRTTGLSHAACGITTDTKYAEEYVRPIAASYETDGSVFLLWERKANYSDVGNGKEHNEDICGVTYIKKSTDAKATVIATFRQPGPEELREKFKADHELVIRPGSDNFFDGGPYPQENPVCEQQMVAAVREYYSCWAAGDVQGKLSVIADSKLHLRDPIWEVKGSFMPVNRVEASMFIERWKKATGGKLRVLPKAIAHAEGTNMVFAFWFSEGMGVDTAGIDLFFFGEDLKIRSVAAFREPNAAERKAHLK